MSANELRRLFLTVPSLIADFDFVLAKQVVTTALRFLNLEHHFCFLNILASL